MALGLWGELIDPDPRLFLQIASGKEEVRRRTQIVLRSLFSMKPRKSLSLLVATACVALFAPQFVRAQGENASDPNATRNSTQNSATDVTANIAAATQAAAQMVPAEVHLPKALDARKARQGDQFEAVVDGTVHLADGAELPHGTIVIGTVTNDQLRANGDSRLALQFTQARLKDGKAVPIRAMIAGISGPPAGAGYMDDSPGPPEWSRQTLQVDEIGVMSHLDLHSRIDGADSGVLVSSARDDVKLAAGSRMMLAIAAEGNGAGGGA
jgi:hypothetical protein